MVRAQQVCLLIAFGLHVQVLPMESAMHSASFLTSAPRARHARLFELIRQQNLMAQQKTAHPQHREGQFSADRLLKTAMKSLQRG